MRAPKGEDGIYKLSNYVPTLNLGYKPQGTPGISVHSHVLTHVIHEGIIQQRNYRYPNFIWATPPGLEPTVFIISGAMCPSLNQLCYHLPSASATKS